MEVMVVGKILLGQDNGSFMHEEYPQMCSVCNYPVKQEINLSFKLIKRSYDVSYTYDGYLIVSKRFKQFCKDRNYSSNVFYELPKEPDFCCVRIINEITLNYEKRGVKFVDRCNKCERYAEVIGATPSFIDDESQIMNNSFYKSSIDFGSYERKSPLIIVTNHMSEELVKHKFKGLYFKDLLKS